ncbi:MAG: discoidin domain-containing protein [Acidobacteriota bacterium]
MPVWRNAVAVRPYQRPRISIFKKYLIAFLLAALSQTASCIAIDAQVSRRAADAVVTINASRALRTFDPRTDLGVGIDGHTSGETDKLLTSENVDEMLTAGFKSVSYRLRTELAIDAWHWNPRGTWSDESGKRGYWTSNASVSADISISSGYRLPRRGTSIDQANNDGYSRIDDGDRETFWKSNPYLDRYFTHEDNALHPQWVVIDLGEKTPINAIEISWGTLFATDCEVQYGDTDDISDISLDPPGFWHKFAQGAIHNADGRERVARLSRRPVMTRLVRVLLKQNAQTTIDTADIRDRLGFSIREITLGKLREDGALADVVRHGLSVKAQTNIIVSSTDPWHGSNDADPMVEQVGFDRLFKSGLADGSPMLVPVGVLFDTPDNAAAEIKYLTVKGYPLSGVEIGEEPDGQYVTPEDYGALYIQWADAIHRIVPGIRLGGPSFQEVQPDTRGRSPRLGNARWLARFVRYLQLRHRESDFSFLSFEWYPFDEVCEPTGPQVARMPRLLKGAIDEFRRQGLKASVPLIISEYGYSAFATRAEVDLAGAVFNADTVGTFLTLGGSQAYLYGYEPNNVERSPPCTAGNNMLFLRNESGKIIARTATYHAARLMMHEWLEPAGGRHTLFASTVTLMRNNTSAPKLAAYAVKRPDGRWSVMLINRDDKAAANVSIRFVRKGGIRTAGFTDSTDLFQFSNEQYRWDPERGEPTKSDPPKRETIVIAPRTTIDLPPYSLTVLRETAGRDRLQ